MTQIMDLESLGDFPLTGARLNSRGPQLGAPNPWMLETEKQKLLVYSESAEILGNINGDEHHHHTCIYMYIHV